jgi:hypothetical protein
MKIEPRHDKQRWDSIHVKYSSILPEIKLSAAAPQKKTKTNVH